MKRNAEIRFKILELAHKMERDAYFAVCQDLDGSPNEKDHKRIEHLPVPEEVLATAEVLAEFVFADEEYDFGEDPCDFGEMIENEE